MGHPVVITRGRLLAITAAFVVLWVTSIGAAYWVSAQQRDQIQLGLRAGCMRVNLDRQENARGWADARDARIADAARTDNTAARAGYVKLAAAYAQRSANLLSRIVSCEHEYPLSSIGG